MTGYLYPSAVDAFWSIVEGEQFAGVTGTPYEHLTVDFADRLPAVHLVLLTGVEGFLERTDRVRVDVYAEDPKPYAEAFRARVVGTNLTVEGVGLLDTIVAELAPSPVPYPSDRINLASAVYRVTTRPK